MLPIDAQYRIWADIMDTNKRKCFSNVFYRDTHPDCHLRNMNGHILLYDFGNKEYWGYTLEEAYYKKYNKFLIQDSLTLPERKIFLGVSFPLIPNIIDWNNIGLTYWGRYDIDISNYPFVQQISGFFLETYFPVHLGFCYWYDHLCKLYLPFSTPKFLGKINKQSTIHLGTKGPLICCKSLKDQLFLDSHIECRTYHVQGEGMNSEPQETPDFIFFDNDDDGIKGAKNYQNKWGGKPIFLKNAKDITEHVMYYGVEKTLNIFETLIN